MNRTPPPPPTSLALLLVTTLALAAGLAPAQNTAPPAEADAESLVAQTALLEATRQDMVTFRLSQLSARFDDLVRDLRSNGIADAGLNDDLTDLARRVQTLRERWVERVKANLSRVADDADPAGPPAGAIASVRADMRRIVRELAVLLLEAGVRHAAEIASTRIEDIAARQRRLLDSTPADGEAADAQRELAEELDELLAELRSLVNPEAKPLAAVRLARVRKMIDRAAAADHMRAAADMIEGADRASARPRQADALAALAAAGEKLADPEQGEDRRDLRRRRLAAARRLDQVRVHQDRQIDFIGRVEAVGDDAGRLDQLLESQRRQLADLESLADALPEADKWTRAIRSPLRRAAVGVRAAIAAFEGGDPETALRESRAIIGALRVAADRVERKVTVLENIESHVELAEDLQFVSGFLGDVEAEQKDIGEQPTPPPGEGPTGDRRPAPNDDDVPEGRGDPEVQAVVAAAVGELRESIEGMAEATIVVEPMTEAEAAMSTLVETEGVAAARAAELRRRAENRVGTARQRADAVARRAAYVAQWLEYLGRQQADLLSLLARQTELRERTEREAERVFAELSGEQDILLGETEGYSGSMEIGKDHYLAAAEEMRRAIDRLDAPDRQRAVFHQERAEEALQAAARALADLMGRIAEITTLERMAAYEAEVHILTKVMMIAVEQRHVRFRTRKATLEEMKEFTAREQEHLRRTSLALTTDERAAEMEGLIDGLEDAANVMAGAVSELREGDREPAIERQQEAEKVLRRFIAELLGQILNVMDIVPPESEGGGGDGWMVNVAMPMEAVRIFGEAPVQPHQATRIGASTWEPLNTRERAALSENFARELPLEYRSMLKAYYRALAE